MGQKCSAESAGVLRGKSQCSLTVLKGCKTLYDLEMEPCPGPRFYLLTN